MKSYFADSVENAIAQARAEMGPDAMLVDSKPASVEARSLGAYEVVVCLEGAGAPLDQPGQTIRPDPRSSTPPAERLSNEVSALRQQIARMALTLARSGNLATGMASDPQLANAFTALTESEVDVELAYEMVASLTSPVTTEAVRARLRQFVCTDSNLGVPAGNGPRIAAFIGPPGAGKTSSLIKLAARFALEARKPSQIVTADTFRIGAADELLSYAAILGIGCQIVDTIGALDQALHEHRQKELVLIDTPGVCSREMDAIEDLASFLAARSDIDVHLVLPASMRSMDLKRIAQQYACFKPQKLLFTRMDETETFGPILSQSVQSRVPVSFLSQGQRIPEDLAAATADLLVDLILKPEPTAERFGMAAA
jgi:flagellar biosynthesis protein FlhF